MIIYLLGTDGDALTTMCARGCEKNAQLCKANLCTLGMMMMMGIIIIIQKFQKI
jgi:hypothetical protein